MKTVDAGLAYNTIYDVDGQPVTDPEQANPINAGESGINRLCSARGVSAGAYGFVDDIHFAGEEQTNGVLFALDNDSEELWAVPDAGLLAWESVAPVETGDDDTVALLVGDDREAAPLWLYVGEKRDGGFLERNGLVGGQLYVWAADANDPAGTFDSPAEFSGNGTTAGGSWVAVDARNADGSLRARSSCWTPPLTRSATSSSAGPRMCTTTRRTRRSSCSRPPGGPVGTEAPMSTARPTSWTSASVLVCRPRPS